LHDIMTSNEAVYVIDPATYVEPGYKPLTDGIQNKNLMGYRLVSSITRQKECGSDGDGIHQYRITNFIDSLINRVFSRALELSNASRLTQFYNTVKNSCATTWWYDTLDYVLNTEATPEELAPLKVPFPLNIDHVDSLAKVTSLNPFNVDVNMKERGMQAEKLGDFRTDPTVGHPI